MPERSRFLKEPAQVSADYELDFREEAFLIPDFFLVPLFFAAVACFRPERFLPVLGVADTGPKWPRKRSRILDRLSDAASARWPDDPCSARTVRAAARASSREMLPL